jgi:serine/threonine-protein kinase HipA
LKKLHVYLQSDPQNRRHVGTLAETGGRIYFEYAPDFFENPLWLSPYKLPPEKRFHEHVDLSFGPVFGLFDDSLPDGWGLLLMDRYLRNKGVDPQTLSVLDRLSFIGNTGMGALTYEPATTLTEQDSRIIRLHETACHARKVLTGDSREVLPQLMRAGGSPGGARPKILVGVKENQLISGEIDLPPGFEHWIIKFAAPNDLADAGPVEYAQSLMAKAAGIDMTHTRIFQTSKGGRFFGIQRFDRLENQRIHIHTFGNLIHSNFRIPSCDYADFFKIIRNLTKNHQDLLQGFRRMVFNILIHNRDDHVKNFAFMMNSQGEWHLTPAYDLTFSHGPGGQHSMTVMGEGTSPGIKEIQAAGRHSGLSDAQISTCLDQVVGGVRRWTEFADVSKVTKKTRLRIHQQIKQQLKRLVSPIAD